MTSIPILSYPPTKSGPEKRYKTLYIIVKVQETQDEPPVKDLEL